MASWYCSSVGWTAATAWAASTAYSIGDIRRQLATPTVGNERVWRCTTAGTSGGTEPAWTLTKASTTNDNTAVWTEITGDAAYNSPTSFAAPHARVENAAAWMATLDTLYVDSLHTQTTAAATTITFPGTPAAPNLIISVDKTTGAILKGAVAEHTGANDLTINGSLMGVGFVISAAVGQTTTRQLNLSAGGGNIQTWKNSDFILGTSGANGRIQTGAKTASIDGVRVTLVDCRFKFASTGQGIAVTGGLSIRGGSIISGGSNVTELIKANNVARDACLVDINGFDFSNLAATVNIVEGGGVSQNTRVLVNNCRMPTAWSGGLVSTPFTVPGASVIADNIAAGASNLIHRSESVYGNCREDTAVYMTGGATDGTTPFSIKMTSYAAASYPGGVLSSLLLNQWNELTGASKTLTVEVVTDNVTLTDADAYLEVEYLGTGSYPLSSFISDAPATVITTPVNQATSTQAWTTTGLTTPVKQALSVALTPNMKGKFRAFVRLTKASTTVYVNPELVVT